jgi:hypothetical protein
VAIVLLQLSLPYNDRWHVRRVPLFTVFVHRL